MRSPKRFAVDFGPAVIESFGTGFHSGPVFVRDQCLCGSSDYPEGAVGTASPRKRRTDQMADATAKPRPPAAGIPVRMPSELLSAASLRKRTAVPWASQTPPTSEATLTVAATLPRT